MTQSRCISVQASHWLSSVMQVKSWQSGRMMWAVIFLTLSDHKVLVPGDSNTNCFGLVGRKVSSRRSEKTKYDVLKRRCIIYQERFNIHWLQTCWIEKKNGETKDLVRSNVVTCRIIQVLLIHHALILQWWILFLVLPGIRQPFSFQLVQRTPRTAVGWVC